MRLPKITRTGREGVNLGLNVRDQHILDRDFDSNTPRVKVSTASSAIDEEEGDQLCSLCGSKLMPIENGHKLMCTYYNCGNIVSVLNHKPLVKVDQSMKPYQSQHYDPNNEGEPAPFFISWNDSGDTTVNKNYEVTYDDGRVKHIKCKGYPSDISINAFND